MRIIDLAGNWTLEALSPMRSSGIAQGSRWDMSIPGSIHDTLLGNGIIEEPYDGTEMSGTSWIEESAWKAETRFTAAKGSDSFLLSCASLSPAEIRINGRTAAASASSILIDATGYLEDGENTIEIIFRGTMGGRSVRCPGIWDGVRLLADPDFILISADALPAQEDGRWHLLVRFTAEAFRDTEAECSVSVNGRTEKCTAELHRGRCSFTMDIDPGDISPWWPQGIGQQPIYPMTVSAGPWQKTIDAAFRTVDTDGEWLVVNGQRIFMKAICCGETDLIRSRTSSGDIERMVRNAAEANMNTLIVESPAGALLADAAARNGLVIIEEDGDTQPERISPSFPSGPLMERIWKGGPRNPSSVSADLHSAEGSTGSILASIASDYLLPRDPGKLIYLSQLASAHEASEAAAAARTGGRSRMILPALSDPWPMISASSTEYGGRWKLLQYAARSFFSPLAPMIVRSARSVSIYFINDTMETASAEFSLKIRDLQGSKKETREYTAEAAPGTAVKVAEYPMNRIDPYNAFLYVKMATKDILRERTVLLASPKALPLEDPELKVDAVQTGPRSFSVKLTAEKPAFCVSLTSPIPGIFSDNLISVRPSAEKTVLFRSEKEAALGEFLDSLLVMDLYTAMN